jgi:hypothetical protein
VKHLTAALFSLLLLAVASDAAAQGMLIGGKIGGNFNQLSQPADPAGEPTVLFGTAFTGFGFQAGASVYRQIKRFGFGPLFVDSDLLLAHQRATGFAESRTTSAKRTIAIHTTSLRLPALLGVGFAGNSSTFSAALGPELLLGIAAGSKTKQEGGASGTAELVVRPVTHLALTGQLGMVFKASGAFLPVNLRLTWDPAVGKSTRDRFVGYADFDNPGEYKVAFNWQAVLMVGWMMDFTGSSTPKEPTPPKPSEEEEDDDVDLG